MNGSGIVQDIANHPNLSEVLHGVAANLKLQQEWPGQLEHSGSDRFLIGFLIRRDKLRFMSVFLYL
jgi:hypothetical protein